MRLPFSFELAGLPISLLQISRWIYEFFFASWSVRTNLRGAFGTRASTRRITRSTFSPHCVIRGLRYHRTDEKDGILAMRISRSASLMGRTMRDLSSRFLFVTQIEIIYVDNFTGCDFSRGQRKKIMRFRTERLKKGFLRIFYFTVPMIRGISCLVF